MFLTIQSVNSIYNSPELYLSYSFNTRLNLVVNELWFDKEPISLIRMKNQRKCGAMDKNVKCLHCHEVKAVEYFELLDMRCGDMNAVTQRV